MDESVRKILDAVNSSVDFDYRLATADIACTVAHVRMLGQQRIISEGEAASVLAGLQTLAERVMAGQFVLKPELEDVHTNIEAALRELVGPAADLIGAARARNDLAVTALRMWVREQIDETLVRIHRLVELFTELGSAHAETVMPGM